jgi:hypothetical protein
MGMIDAYSVLVGKPEGKRPLEKAKRRWKITLEWILGKYGGELWTGCFWFRIRTSAGFL